MKTLTLSLIAALAIATSITPALAQDTTRPPAVSLDVQDAPVRTAIEALFKQAGVKNYLIDSKVAGFVTLTLTDQPLESALKLVMRANTMPLTYTKENDVWVVRPRQAHPVSAEPPAAPQSAPTSTTLAYERISLTYLDPMDIETLVGGILYVRSFTRQTGVGTPAGTGVLRGNGNSGQLGGVVLQGGGAGPKPQ